MSSWYRTRCDVLERQYLAGANPWHQSGFSGTRERWDVLRRPVADAVWRSGSFLDIGCANGFLLECVVAWVAERGLTLELHGIDLSEGLVALARRRLPRWAQHLHGANGWDFRPSRRFDVVRTELCYVPAGDEGPYVRRLLTEIVAPGGELLVANYLEGADDAAARVPQGARPTTRIVERLVELGYSPERVHDGLDPVKGRRTRVAVLRAPVAGET